MMGHTVPVHWNEFPSVIYLGTNLYTLERSCVTKPILEWFADWFLESIQRLCTEYVYFGDELLDGEHRFVWSDKEFLTLATTATYPNWAIYRRLL